MGRKSPHGRIFGRNTFLPFVVVIGALAALLGVAERRYDFHTEKSTVIRVRASVFQDSATTTFRTPPELRVLFYLSDSLERLGRESTAGRLLEAAADSLPDSLQALVHLRAGRLLLSVGEDSLAAAALEKCVRAGGPEGGEAGMLISVLQGAEDTSLAANVGAIRRFLKKHPGYPPAFFRLGLLHQRRGMHREALEAYDRALSVFPAFKEARWNKALILSAIGRDAEAQSEFQTLARLFPAQAEYHFAMARLHGRQGRSTEAMEAYRKAVSVRGGNYPEAFFNMALLNKSSGRVDSARIMLEKALALKPDYNEAWYNMGLMRLEAKELPEAAACFRKAVAVDSNYKEAEFNLGLALARLEKLDSAILAYRSALRIDPRYTKARIALANRLDQADRREEVARVYRDGLGIDSSNAEFWFGLGLAMRKLDSIPASISAYRKALALDPGIVKALNNLGLALAASGSRAEAIEVFRNGLNRFPDNFSMRFNLAVQYARQGHKEDALLALEKAGRLDPSHEATRRMKAELLLDLARPDEALAAFRQAIPPDASPKEFNDAALALAKRGYRTQAASLLEEALRKHPDRLAMRFNLALQYSKLNRLPESLKHLGDVLKQNPQHTPSLRLSGEILARQGKRSEAIAAYRRSLEIEPDNADAMAAMKSLGGT